MDTEIPVKKMDMTGDVKGTLTLAFIAFLAFSISPSANAYVTTTTMVKVSGQSSTSMCGPQQTINFNRNVNDTTYGDYDAVVFFITCGEYVGQPIVIAVDAAINFSPWQNAEAYYFSFDNAWLWTPQNGCESGLVTHLPPAVNMTLVQKASASGVYTPPAYGGQDTLCFSYAGSFKPILYILLSNGTTVTVHPRNDQTYRLDITNPPLPTQGASFLGISDTVWGGGITLLFIVSSIDSLAGSKSIPKFARYLKRRLTSKKTPPRNERKKKGAGGHDKDPNQTTL